MNNGEPIFAPPCINPMFENAEKRDWKDLHVMRVDE